MFGRTKEEILGYKDSIMGPIMVVLEDDMLTVKEEPRHHHTLCREGNII